MRTTKRLILLVISTTKQIGNLAQAPPLGGAILLLHIYHAMNNDSTLCPFLIKELDAEKYDYLDQSLDYQENELSLIEQHRLSKVG